MAKKSKPGRRPGSTNRVRIIGGDWGGRRLDFPDAQGLRPTSDRVRETLFNWLQYDIYGSRVLDAFAGSGVLGFEAASRGAREVVMLEKARTVTEILQKNAAELHADNVCLLTVDALDYLRQADEPFDLVFLDPPFGQGLIEPILALLDERGLLKPDTKIYVEFEAAMPTPSLPEGWVLIRDKTAGDVRFGLIAAVS